MALLPAILLLTLSLFCLAQADSNGNVTPKPQCGKFVRKNELKLICRSVTHFSDIIQVLTSDDQVATLEITGSPQLTITRADMDHPAFVNMKKLDFERYVITSFNSEPFRGLTHLKELSFEFNNITSILSDTFEGVVNVESLDLSNNQITTIDQAAFKGFHNLTVLWLNGNKLSSIDDHVFEGLGLTSLSLAHNLLTSIDETSLSGLSKLKSLTLSGNKLKTIQNGAFTSLKSLVRLDLGYTQLEGLDSKLFVANSNLKILSLTRIDMGQIDNFSLNISTLEFLSIDKCNIQNITADFFQNLPKLKGVALDSNHLTTLDDNLFTQLPELLKVNLRQNNLTSLSVSSFKQIHQIVNRAANVDKTGLDFLLDNPSVKLLWNPWNCQTQEMTELFEWMGVRNMTVNEFFDCRKRSHS